MNPPTGTDTDPRDTDWTISDDVIRLREWGSDTIYPLPPPPSPAAPRPQGDWFVGTAPECLLRLEDPSGYVSRRHARLLREPAYWSLLDLGSKNGMRVNGTLQATARLTPGTEIGLGGLTLIAESARSIEIRCFLARLLGWTAERAVDIDLALRAVRLAQVQRTPLVLRGEGDLVPLARDLHRRVLGRSRPFVLCDPHRQSVEENVRVSANIECGLAALRAARGGSLCVRNQRRPLDFLELVAALRDPATQTQLILCDSSAKNAESQLAIPITIPSLSSRSAEEITLIIDQYCEDAGREYQVRRRSHRMDDRAWILEHSASSLSEIEKGAYRLTALRCSPSLAAAAERLGMAKASLHRWIGRRAVPGIDRPDLD